MECSKVKIKELIIQKLHGHIDYDIKFNNDVTFLYGDNGCGKTTVLNILTSIITARVYELSKYNYNSITVVYYATQEPSKLKNITVKNNGDSIILTFNEAENNIDIQRVKLLEGRSENRFEDSNEIERLLFSEYKVLNDIKQEFSYIYLPLNRYGSINDERMMRISRKIIRASSSLIRYSDMTLYDVSFLVKESYNKINFTLSKINENFSEELLKSFLDIENISNAAQLLQYANKLSASTINQIKNDYTEVLKTIKKWDSVTEKKITDFFESLLKDINESENDGGFSIEILFKLSELIKITNVIKKAEKIELSKKRVSQPLSSFLNAVNKFINMKTTKKEIYIDTEGQVLLKTPYNNKIDLIQLSSGEKQIVTFFAYLIFGLSDTKQSLFIVDEPELSLHLQWQRQFVDTILEINPDIQLIFATHAPEIIGKHIDKSFKLVPIY